MEKVIVIGCPGSGKSTFSRALHRATGLPLFHLDMLHWNADKTTVPQPVFLDRLQTTLAKDTWIIDGNYGSTMELRLRCCDTVFFLDYPPDVCLGGIASRRGKKRWDMPWNGPMEEDEEFLAFVRNFPSGSRPAILDLLRKYPEKNWIVFRGRDEADAFLKRLQDR